MPLAFHTTDASNNTIVFERSGSVKRASVPNSSYNAVTFPPALEKAMNDASTTKDFTVTWDENTRLLTIAAGLAFTIHPFSAGTTIYRQLGMQKQAQPVTGTSVTFGIPDFTNTSPLLLTSSQLNSKHMVFAGEENVNVLCMIDVAAPQNSVAKWINYVGTYCEVGSEMPSVDFRLLNASTLIPIELSQPFAVTMSIVTDIDDLGLIT